MSTNLLFVILDLFAIRFYSYFVLFRFSQRDSSPSRTSAQNDIGRRTFLNSYPPAGGLNSLF
jgi:hypothetical protein